MAATVTVVLDMTIANVALSSIAGNIGATHEQSSWILTSYVVAETVAMPMTAWFVGKFNAKKMFIYCILGFTASSLLCGASTTITQIVFFRFIQGLFGAGIIPLSQSILIDMNEAKDQGKAMAIWGMGIMIGPILGPSLGGYITEYYSWRYIFFINLPIGILSTIGLLKYLPEIASKGRKFDFLGCFLFSVFICSLQLFLDRGEEKDWLESGEIKTYLFLCITFFAGFIHHVVFSKKKNTIINMDIFKDKNYAVSTIFSFCVGMILFSSMSILPPFMETILGYDTIQCGLLLAPRGCGVFIAMFMYAKFGNKIDQRIIIIAGFLLIGGSMYQMTDYSEYTSTIDILIPSIIQGVGLGFCFPPLSAIGFSTLDPKLRSEATSIFSLIRNIGSSVGISIIIFFSSRSSKENYGILSENINPSSKNFIHYTDIAEKMGQGEAIQGLMIQNELLRQSMIIGYLNTFKLIMVLALCVIPLVLIIKKSNNFSNNNETMAH